jgi:ribokinase
VAHGRVIVVGSLNVDLVVRAPRLPSPGDTVIGSSFARHGGGKGANKALASARAGARTVFIGAVGADQAGDESLAELAGEGVDVGRCLRLRDVATGVALIVVDEAGDNQIAVAPGANARLGGPAVADALADVGGRPADVVLTDFEVGAEAVAAALRWATAVGARVVVNPAPARPIEHVVMSAHPILTPNASEAIALTGAQDPHGAAHALSDRSGAPVIVTLGADGALLVDAGTERLVPGHAVEAVDTTGAGDALNGILCAALARGDALADALRWATAGAAISTTAPGARGALPRSTEIDRLLAAS